MIYIIIYKHGNEIDREYYFSTHLSVFESYIVFESCVINVFTVFHANIILLYQLTIYTLKAHLVNCSLRGGNNDHGSTPVVLKLHNYIIYPYFN